MPQLTKAQLDERVSGLGGTDMAALAGVSRWAKPIDVFFDKRPDLAPERPERETKPMMAMGHLLEPIIADLFTEATGVRLRSRVATIRCKDHPWEIGHVDRRVHGDPGALFEAKWAMSKDGWAPSATLLQAGFGLPLIPPGYGIQVQWYMHVAPAYVAYLGALLGWADFRWYQVEKDKALLDTLVELAYVFWHEHVIPGIPPEPDGSEAYDKMLRRLYPKHTETTMVATPQVAGAIRDLRRVVEQQAALATSRAQLEQRVQTAMGRAAVLDFPGGRVTWRQNKPSMKVEWPDVAHALAYSLAEEFRGSDTDGQLHEKAQAFVDEEVERHSKPKAGARPFVVKWEAEDAE